MCWTDSPPAPQVNFHTTLSGEAIVTMLYHRRLDADWEAAAGALRSRLAACEGLAGALTLAGRSRGQKLVLGPGHVTERLRVGARQLLYRQVGECGRCMPVDAACPCLQIAVAGS